MTNEERYSEARARLTEEHLNDVGKCHKCGREEAMILLDGFPIPGSNPETSDWEYLLCWQCGGDDWSAP